MHLRALMLQEDYEFWCEHFGECAEEYDEPAVGEGKKPVLMVEYSSYEAQEAYEPLYYFIEANKPLICVYHDAENGSTTWMGATLNGKQAHLPLVTFGHAGELMPVVSTDWLTTTPEAASVKNNSTFNHLYHILLVEEFGVCEPEDLAFFNDY